MKYCELVTKLNKPKKDLRESYIQGDLFNVGDIVKTDVGPAEVINLGTNYLTLVAEGKTFKKWLTEVSRIDEVSKGALLKYMDANNNANRSKKAKQRNKGFSRAFDRVYANGALSFKGYDTKNFTAEHAEFFRPILEHKDQFAVLNCIQAVDSLIGMSEDFDTLSRNHSRAVKYFRKFSLDESLLDECKERLLETAILENKILVAEGVVESCISILKSIYNIESKMAEDVLQESVSILGKKQGYILSEGWETLGTFARIMKANGVSIDTHEKIKTLLGV